MADAVLWDLLTSIQTGLRSDLSFVAQGTDTVPTIASEAIVIRKVSVRKRDVESSQNQELKPGLIISPPLKVTCSPEAGTNTRDDVMYPILIQLIAADQHRKEENLRTYLKWEEQIRKYLNAQRREISTEGGCVYIGNVTVVDVVDEKIFVADQQFQSGIVVEYMSREPRGVS